MAYILINLLVTRYIFLLEKRQLFVNHLLWHKVVLESECELD